MLDTSVKYFNNTMSGAPALPSSAGSLITLLDACLVNGFDQVTLNSLVVADNVATGTVNPNHNFTMTGNTGPVILIAGATPSELNGEWRIASIPGSTTFTFITSGITNQTATGTITAKRAAAGWTKALSGTNKAAYSRTAFGVTSMLLRVDDTPGMYPTLTMYETMTSVDAGSGASTLRYFAKGNSAAWRLFANDKIVHILNKTNGGSSFYNMMSFGDIISYKNTDTYHCILRAFPAAAHFSNTHALSFGFQLARTHTGLGSAVACSLYSHSTSANFGTTSQTYPSLVDNCFHAWPVEVWESVGARGVLPGIWNPLHTASVLPDLLTITDIPQLPDRTLLITCDLYDATSCIALDITGPWS